MSNTAGLYYRPAGHQDGEYVLMADGKWYHKDIVHELALERAADDMTRQEHYAAMAENPRTEDELKEALVDIAMGVGDVNSDEKGSGARYNAGKPPMAYIPINQQLLVLCSYGLANGVVDLLLQLARFERGIVSMDSVIRMLTIEDLREASYVWEYGAKKYAPFNWAKGMQWSIPLSCISRHVQAIAQGEDSDEESGCTHWGHVVCNLLMLQHYELFYKEGDDRPPAEVFNG